MTTELIPKGKTIKLYKFLNDDHTGTCSGKPWPVKNGRTRWLKCKGELVLCENGYHGCEEKDLIEWGLPNLYVMEARGEILRGDDKVCCREVRLIRKVKTWNEKTQRLFAADCAEHVLHSFEVKYPDDNRPRVAIETARKYARGEASDEELRAATDAAWDAAEATAWDAAEATDAAWDAADAAADAAAHAADRRAMQLKIVEYGLGLLGYEKEGGK